MGIVKGSEVAVAGLALVVVALFGFFGWKWGLFAAGAAMLLAAGFKGINDNP
jgi:hypothetical protein